MESTVFNTIRDEALAQGAAKVVARQLRRRLGKSKAVESLLERLPLCSTENLEKISIFVVEKKKKKDLLAAVERLLPKKKD